MQLIRVIKKVLSILSQHQKLRVFELVLMMFLGAVLEMCSVSMILPFMDSVMNPEEAMSKWYAKLLCGILHIDSAGAYLFVLALLLALLYILKNAFLIIEYNTQYKFVYGNMFALRQKLYAIIIHRPYEYFLNARSSDLFRIVNNDTHSAFMLLMTLLSLLTESFVSVLLVVTLLVVSPMLTLCVLAVLLVFLLIILLFLRPIMYRAGRSEQISVSSMLKWLLQSFEGIKDIKVMRKEDFFQENFDHYGLAYVTAMRKHQTLSNLSRFIIEGICMGSMFFVIAFLINGGKSFETIVPMLTALAMAAIRLLPSVNRISASMTTITYGEPMLDQVIESMRLLDNSQPDTSQAVEQPEKGFGTVPKLQKCIQFHNISYHYPNTEKRVLTKASMIIHRGESVGIVGPSGAGKTTAVDILLGLLDPQEGGVMVDGVNIKNDPEAWLKQIGYIPQTIFMLDGTIRENIAFGVNADDINDADVWLALKEAALDEFVRSLPDGLDTEIGERGIRLSGGQRQRIGIARALYPNPEVLFFDEATSALDNDTETDIMESIYRLRGARTIIIIAHRLTTIEACDHIFCVENEKIVQQR